MPNTMTLIASYTATGAVSSIVFSSIPNTYTDLLLQVSARSDVNTAAVRLDFNGTAVNSSKVLYGNGASALSVTSTTYVVIGGTVESGATGNTYSNASFYIPNYLSSNNKSVSIDGVAENNGTTAYIGLGAALWSNAAAITSITVKPNSDNFAASSTAYLYGIKKD